MHDNLPPLVQILATDYKLQASEQTHKNLKRNLEEESRRNSRTPAQVNEDPSPVLHDVRLEMSRDSRPARQWESRLQLEAMKRHNLERSIAELRLKLQVMGPLRLVVPRHNSKCTRLL